MIKSDHDDEELFNSYVFIFLAEAIIFLIIISLFINMIYPITEKDSAKYLLSSLIQGEITIIAIVLSFYLVVVQLIAIAHSARAIRAFKKNKYFWMLLILYTISISLACFILKTIESISGNTSNLEPWIILSLNLGIISLIALFPFAWKTLSMLNPVNVLDMISKEIDEKDFLTPSGISKGSLQPITEIILVNIAKNDQETVLYGFGIISLKLEMTISKDKITSQNEFIVGKTIFHHPYEICRYSINCNYEYLSFEILEFFKKIIFISIENHYNCITSEAICKIGLLAILSEEKNMKNVALKIILLLREIGEKIEERGLSKENSDLLFLLIIQLRMIAKSSIYTNSISNVIQSIKSIESLIETTEVLSVFIASESLLHLKFIAHRSILRKLDGAAIHSIISIRNITLKSANIKLCDNVGMGIMILKDLGISSCRSELAGVLASVIQSFDFIIKNNEINKNNKIDIIESLFNILKESQLHSILAFYSCEIEKSISKISGGEMENDEEHFYR